MKTLLLLAVIMAIGKILTSGHKGLSPGREAPSAPGFPPLSEVGARGWQGEAEEVTGSQAPSPAAVLPGLLQGRGSLADFQKMVKFTTGKEPATNYSFYGCYCGMRGRGTPKDATDR